MDDYVICNYYFNSEDGETILDEELDRPRKFNQLSLALDYWFETNHQELTLDQDLGSFREHMKKTTTLRNTISTMSKNIEMFLSYLEFNKIQYVIVQNHLHLNYLIGINCLNIDVLKRILVVI